MNEAPYRYTSGASSSSQFVVSVSDNVVFLDVQQFEVRIARGRRVQLELTIHMRVIQRNAGHVIGVRAGLKYPQWS